MIIRITSIPRSLTPNSGFHPYFLSAIRKDEVWALPSPDKPLFNSPLIRYFFHDQKYFFFALPVFFQRFLSLVLIFFRALFTRNSYFFVHSYIYALPLFLLNKPYCIVIHGSDYRYMSIPLSRILAAKASSLFIIGTTYTVGNLCAVGIPNIFNIQPITDIQSSILKDTSSNTQSSSYDILFVLRDSPVKNPKYPDLLFRNLPSSNYIRIGVVGIDSSTLYPNSSYQGLSISYLGRLDYESLVKTMFCSSLLIIPSISEGISKSMLEALHCGMNVVVSSTINLPAEFLGYVYQTDLYDFSTLHCLIQDLFICDNKIKNSEFANRYYNQSLDTLLTTYYNVFNC